MKSLLNILTLALCTTAFMLGSSPHAAAQAQDAGQVMLYPIYYTAKPGENLKVVAKKYRLKLRPLVSRNRIAGDYIFRKPKDVIIGYALVPATGWKNPPENAFITDTATARLYNPVDANFLADSVSISAKEFAALTLPPEPVAATEQVAVQPTPTPAPEPKPKPAPAPRTEVSKPKPVVKETVPVAAEEPKKKPGKEDSKTHTTTEPADTSADSAKAFSVTEIDPTINNIAPDKDEIRRSRDISNERINQLELGADSVVKEVNFFIDPFEWAVATYDEQPTIIQRGLIILSFFVVCNIILFLVIISSRIYKNYVELRTKRLTEVYEPLMANLIFGEYDTEERRSHIIRRIKKRYLVNEFNNEVFMRELLNLHKNFTGDVCDNIRSLYLDFNLTKVSMRKLKSFPWDMKIKGMRELTQMDIKDAYDEIFKYVDSQNGILRLETLLSLIQLSESDPLKFLSNTKANMTGWQQVNILAILSILNTDDLPDFKRWINSPNDSVVLFTVRMINHFKQIASVNAIVPMLDDPRAEIREAVVNTIGNLELYGFADQLVETYHKEQDRMKIRILQILSKISDDDQIPFFRQELFNPNFAIALNSAIAMVKTGNKGKEELLKLAENTDERTQRIVLHAMDKRIVG